MDLNYNLYLERANNEIKFADIALFVSNNKSIQVDVMKIEEPETYYSSVISHSYYCIFYSAKAILIKEGIKTEAPKVHMCYPFIISLRYNNSFHFIKPPLSSS